MFLADHRQDANEDVRGSVKVTKKHDEPTPGGLAFPLRLFLSLLIVVFGMELLTMFILPLVLPGANGVVLGFVDSFLLTILISPFLYFLIRREMKERRRTEEAMEERSRELARSNAELEQFAYAVSHDLREPLRMVHVYLQLLGKRYQGKLDKDADEFIGFAVDGATRMQRLINDLLLYSRVGSKGKEPQPIDSHAGLRHALDNLQETIQESGAVIDAAPLPMVMGDEGQLIQLFQNLIANAIKFRGDAPPRVAVMAEPHGGEWLFSVRDNGIGIEEKNFARIFQIFQRLHDRDSYPGTGIGLAVCKKIVERLGGRIWLKSELNQGTTFYFTLARVKGDIS